MQFAPAYVDRQPLTAEEEAYKFLLDAICGGRYHKGDRLIAEDIASEIGMSRMPVREAFRRLDAQGLVTLRPNRGAIVSGLDIDELHEVFEMRSALEGLAVRVAVGRIGERQLAALERLSTRWTTTAMKAPCGSAVIVPSTNTCAASAVARA